MKTVRIFSVLVEGDFNGGSTFGAYDEALAEAELAARAERVSVHEDEGPVRKVYVMQSLVEVVARQPPITIVRTEPDLNPPKWNPA